MDTAVPAIENLPLNDLASLKDGYHTARKFTSCVTQEINGVKKGGEENGDEDHDDDDDDKESDKEMVGDFHIRSNFFLADEKLTCVAIFPDPGLELLAGGDERGALSLWFRSGDEDDDMGRTCRFVPHSDEVTSVEFGWADR